MKYSSKIKSSQGFTLIEVMVVVVIVAIFAAIAIPSYLEYARRATASQAQQEIQRLAVLLDRHKARNFNYRGFSISSTTVAQDSSFPYTISIVDNSTSNPALNANSAIGQGWAIKAETSDPKNYTLLQTSTGLKCKNKTSAVVTFDSCSTTDNGSEEW